MRRIAFLLLSILLVVFLSGCGSPNQSVKMFLKYLLNQDTEAAKLYATDEVDELIEAGGISPEYLGFVAHSGARVTWSGIKNGLSLVTESKTKKAASIAVGSGYGDIKFQLIYEGGMWKISEVEVVKE